MEKPKVSVVMANYNGKHLLQGILNSLKNPPYKSYEIIVVDNNSSDRSREFIKKNCKNVKLIENRENLGYSGINSAIPYCKGKYVLFLNNDMELDKDCIKNLVEVLESDKSVGLAAPKLVNYYHKNLVSGGTWLSRAFYNGHIKGTMKSKNKQIPYLGVGMIRKEIIKKYGYLFDPDYFIYGEDVDLGLRVRLLGKKTLFVGNAIIYHMHAYTTKNFVPARTTYLMEKNLLTTYLKDLPISMLLLYYPYITIFRLVALLKDLATFNFKTFFARLKAVGWVKLHFFKILKKRREIQKHRKAPIRFIKQIFNEKHLYKKKFIV